MRKTRLPAIKYSLVLILVSMRVCAGECHDSVSPDLCKSHYVRIAVDYDLTGSCNGKCPEFSEAEIRHLLLIVERSGGEVAFARITEQSNEPMLRQSFLTDTVPVVGLLSERAAAMEHNNSIRNKYAARREAFVQRAVKFLHLPRDRQKTDLRNSLNRIEAYFSEPATRPCVNIAVLLTDLEHNADQLPLVVPPGQIIVVGASSAEARQLFGDRVMVFEGLDACLNYLETILAPSCQDPPTSLVNVRGGS
jgi:hypothetical protein